MLYIFYLININLRIQYMYMNIKQYTPILVKPIGLSILKQLKHYSKPISQITLHI